MIGAAELAALQAAWQLVCDQTATVQRNSSLGTPNADGTVSSTLSAVYTGIPAWVGEPTGNYAQALAAALVDQATWQVALPQVWQGAAVDVRRGDTIVITSMGNLTLTIQHILSPQSYTLNNNFIASRPR